MIYLVLMKDGLRKHLGLKDIHLKNIRTKNFQRQAQHLSQIEKEDERKPSD